MASALHIETIGKGPHLAMLHGWGMNHTVWQHTAKTLSKHFTVHLVDLPGMGQSDSITPYDLETVSAVIAEQLPDQTTIIGWSMGGLIALNIALTQPDVVKKLVLVATTPCFVNVKGFSRRSHWHAGVDQVVFDDFSENVKKDYLKAMLNFLALQCMGSDEVKPLMRKLKAQFKTQPIPDIDVLQSALSVLLQSDLREQVSQITQPTMIIHGDKDRLVPLQAGNWLAQALPNSQLRVINGAAHAPFLSHQATFDKALEGFLNMKRSVWRMFFK